jgi:hypothetical protein
MRSSIQTSGARVWIDQESGLEKMSGENQTVRSLAANFFSNPGY